MFLYERLTYMIPPPGMVNYIIAIPWTPSNMHAYLIILVDLHYTKSIIGVVFERLAFAWNN